MKLITFIFLISTNILFGQIAGYNYEVNVGKLTFRPMVIYDYKPSKGVWLPGSDEDLKEFIVKYPIRTDTIIDHNKKKIGLTSDKYTINYFVDSISVNYLDTLLKQSMSITHKDNKCNIYGFNIQIVSSDGRIFFSSHQSSKLTFDKKLVSFLKHGKQDFYFVISLIKFQTDKNEKLEINDKYGWKVKVKV